MNINLDLNPNAQVCHVFLQFFYPNLNVRSIPRFHACFFIASHEYHFYCLLTSRANTSCSVKTFWHALTIVMRPLLTTKLKHKHKLHQHVSYANKYLLAICLMFCLCAPYFFLECMTTTLSFSHLVLM